MNPFASLVSKSFSFSLLTRVKSTCIKSGTTVNEMFRTYILYLLSTLWTEWIWRDQLLFLAFQTTLGCLWSHMIEWEIETTLNAGSFSAGYHKDHCCAWATDKLTGACFVLKPRALASNWGRSDCQLWVLVMLLSSVYPDLISWHSYIKSHQS